MESTQRTQKELNAQVSMNKQNNQLNLRLNRIEKNLDIIIEMLVKEKEKQKKKG